MTVTGATTNPEREKVEVDGLQFCRDPRSAVANSDGEQRIDDEAKKKTKRGGGRGELLDRSAR